MEHHKAFCEERDLPWDPLGVQEEVGHPSLDLLQGETADHQDQTLCVLVPQDLGCFLYMSHLGCLQGEGALGEDP